MMLNAKAAGLLAEFYFSPAISDTAQAIRMLVEKALLDKEYHEYTPEEMAYAIQEYMDFMDRDFGEDELFTPIFEDEDEDLE